MAVTYLKTTWATRILDQLNKNLVARRATNENYTQDAKDSNIVHVFTPGDIPTKNYTRNTDLPAADITTETDTTLLLNQQKAVDFFMDRIDIRQCPVKITEAYMDRAAYSMADVIDQFVIGQYVNVHANNIYSPTVAMTSSNVHQYFAEVNQMLTDTNNPVVGRFAIIDGWVKKIINEYLSGKGTTLGDNATANGYIGRFCEFDLLLSHNVPQTSENMGGTASDETVHNVLCGTTEGITFAMQIPFTGPGALEAFQPEKRFGTEVKGLCVYGAKMVRTGLSNGLLKAWG